MKPQRHLLAPPVLPVLPVLLAALLTALPPAAPAQQATERYIPLGASPGVSGKTAMMGTVVGYADGVLTLNSPAYPGPQRVRMASATRIWLDRSTARRPNMPGSAADLLPGRRVEVKFVDPSRREVADWVKVEPPASP
jgi:hypothetical protein